MSERLAKIKQTDLAALPAYFDTLPITPGHKILPDLSEAEWAAIGQKFFYADWLARASEEARKCKAVTA